MGKMLSICVYADTTGLFSEEECEKDNLVDIDFPEWIVREWYNDHKAIFDDETSYELNKPINDCTFDDWYYEVSWAGDTDGLYEFALTKGFKGKRYEP